MTPQEIISDDEIARVHGNANFGAMDPREVVNDGIRKTAVGYHCGSTQLHILRDHGLVTKPRPGSSDADLTKKGKAYARSIYRDTTPARAEAQDEGAAGEIKPCPFCGAGAQACKNDHDDPVWSVECDECPASLTSDRFNRETAIAAWNARAHPSPTPAADADRVRIAVEALEPFVPVWAKLTGLSDGIDVRLDASFPLQDATGRARGATCNPNLPKLTVGDFRKAHKALAALKSTAAKEGGE